METLSDIVDMPTRVRIEAHYRDRMLSTYREMFGTDCQITDAFEFLARLLNYDSNEHTEFVELIQEEN